MLPRSAGSRRPDYTESPDVNPERRGRTRKRVHWQVRFLKEGAANSFVTKTRDLSSRGFYCLTPVPLRPGDLTVCVLNVPAHQSDDTLPLNCKARVIRVEPPNEDGFYGAGCQIEDYWLARVTDATQARLSAQSPD